MKEDYKKALYDTFLKDTPIKYEQVTDEQFMQMNKTVTGAAIGLNMAVKDLMQNLAKGIKAAGEALTKGMKGIK